MIAALEPLAGSPGVELVMMVTPDGVPITVLKSDSASARASLAQDDALSAMTASWVSELARAVAPLSWDEPKRAVMRCVRGTLVAQTTRNAVLVVLLSKGLSPEDIRLSMDGALARIERGLRNMGSGSSNPSKVPKSDSTSAEPAADNPGVEDPPSPLPSENSSAVPKRD